MLRTSVHIALTMLATAAGAESINIDFGQPDDVPPATYAAAGRAGVWNALVAPDGSTTFDLLDVDGDVTDVSVRQLGGTATVTVDDPTTLGEDSLLLDDYLVTFNAQIESCLFFENVDPGRYEVLIDGWMPLQPAVFSYTNIDQEDDNPHYEVGGPWTGEHAQLVTYSRHILEVGADGILNMHSGIVPAADPRLGAALHAVQLRPFAEVSSDGFESGDTAAWTATVPN